MPTLESLQAEIDELKAQLQSQQPQDTLSPNYLTIENGKIGAAFTGLINALGLIIPANTSGINPEADNELVWQRASDGRDVAILFGSSSAGDEALVFQVASPPNSTDTVELDLELTSDFAALLARFIMSADQATGETFANIVMPGLGEVQIIDNAGNSSFLQASMTVGSGKHYYNAGNAAVNFNGSLSQDAPIPHGLLALGSPITPKAVFVASNVAGAYRPVQLNTWDATNIYVSAGTGFSGNTDVAWLAIA